ncbi:MAG: argininosuccinate lyase [Chloroflexota bacterium]|nr:argininosuccinate lyase [Chloroflexota bacterium]
MNKNKNNRTSSIQGGEIYGEFTSSFDTDIRMYREDIAVSIAYSKMLEKIQLISKSENENIVKGLSEILQEIESNRFKWNHDLEDIHLNIEETLYKKIGDTAGKLHFGRSRNDQVATDVRLFFKHKIADVRNELIAFLEELISLSDKNKNTIMPGYTHLQKGQPVLLSHYLMAYFAMLSRDLNRIDQCLENLDTLPLGSGAFAGVTIPIDREFLAKELGFTKISSNSIDSVSSRDHILDVNYVCSSTMLNLSRICEEFIIWSTEEFDFINLPEKFTTGSSIMPQKKNPDYLELIRGKTGGVIGNLMGLMTTLKALPFTYNRDLQEDRNGAMKSVDILIDSLGVLKSMFSEISFNKDKMLDASLRSDILATDFADYLAFKKIPFREAYEIIKKVSIKLSKEKKSINELSLNDFKKISDLFDEDIMKIDLKYSIEKRNSIGGTSTKSLKEQLKNAKIYLRDKKNV